MYNVFVSHRHEDDHLVEALKVMLLASGCEVRISAVKLDSPTSARDTEHLRSILAARIRWAGQLIVIISPETKEHTWVDWEIEYAYQKGKRIIGVWAPGATGCGAPRQFERHARAVAEWDPSGVADALAGHDNWNPASVTE
jgi:hypothetical protein